MEQLVFYSLSTQKALVIIHGCSAVTKGDRIAQLILERIMTPPVEEVDSLEVTKRGGGGYGSTGVQGQLPP